MSDEMMSKLTIEDFVDHLDEILDEAKSVPFAQGKLVDVDALRQCINDIRLHMPEEMKQAKKIVQDRRQIHEDAKKTAEDMIKTAEKRAKEMIDNSNITKEAEKRAAEIERQANEKARNIKRATDDYLFARLQNAEATLAQSVSEITRMKNAVKAPKQQPQKIN